MNKNNLPKSLSWGARYTLLILTRLTSDLSNSTVRDITILQIANESSLSERSVSSHIKELKELGLIGIERDLIFGKGRGVNTYNLFEKFKLKLNFGRLNNLIIKRVLAFSNITPIQKFILVVLISEADDFGIVSDLGFSQLIKMTGISRNALKTNLKEMLKADFVYGYTTGGNLPVFLGKIKGVFYLNFVGYKPHELVQSNNFDSTLEVLRRFNKNFNFIDIDVIDYINTSIKLKKYATSLTEHSCHTFFSTIIRVVDHHSGLLLTTINNGVVFDEKGLQEFISNLRENTFKINIGGNIESVNYVNFKKSIKNIKDSNWDEIYRSIKTELFKDPNFNFNSSDSLNDIRKELYEEIIYLVNYYAFRTYFQLISRSDYPQKFTFIRDYNCLDKQNRTNTSMPMILLETGLMLQR